MKYLEKVLQINEIAREQREQASREYLEAKERVKGLPIAFGDDADMMLSNHLMALIRRILQRQFVEPLEDEMMSELSEDAWNYAHRVVDPLFAAHGLEADRSEVFLVGTHMEMAIAAAAPAVQ